MVELAPILSKLASKRSPYDAAISLEEFSEIQKKELKLEYLEEEIRNELQDNRTAQTYIRNLINERFDEAVQIASTSREMQKAIAQLAQDIAQHAQAEMMNMVGGIHLSKKAIKKAVESATEKEVQNVARDVVRHGFIKSRIQLIKSEGVQELKAVLDDVKQSRN
jgi:hypothetical protein